MDFGDEAVQETDLRDLGRYNVVQRDTKITRLWVMTRGQLTAVDLEAPVDTTREAIPRVAEVPPSSSAWTSRSRSIKNQRANTPKAKALHTPPCPSCRPTTASCPGSLAPPPTSDDR